MNPAQLAHGLPALLALAIAMLLLSLERPDRAAAFALAPVVVLVPLAAGVIAAPRAGPAWTALLVALVVAMLARDEADRMHGECAIKMLWVMGGALALSWAGISMLTVATGTPMVREQWAVLNLGLDPRFLWSTALPLSLLAGMVLLGAAPFHFWMADLFQGARAWLAPLAVTALQVGGAGWLMRRLEGIESFEPGFLEVEGLLSAAAAVAFVIGAVTLATQRRPERRVGTLASLHGALVLGALAATHGRLAPPGAIGGFVAGWAAHLVVALTGAGLLARFMPAASGPAEPGAALFRRHPVTGLVSLVSLFSLSGVPGTPGAALWLGVARDLAAAGHIGVLLTLAVAWLAAFGSAVRALHEGFGVPVPAPPPERPVPASLRLALWASSVGVAAVGIGRLLLG